MARNNLRFNSSNDARTPLRIARGKDDNDIHIALGVWVMRKVEMEHVSLSIV
jgi:hypothetical protein